MKLRGVETVPFRHNRAVTAHTGLLGFKPDKSQHYEGDLDTKSHPQPRSYFQLMSAEKGKASFLQ